MQKSRFKKHTVMSVAGITLTVICALCAVLWEVAGREAYLYKSVLVVTRDIIQGDVITMDMLGEMKTEDSNIISNPIKDPEKVIGLAAKHNIPRNSQITADYFENPSIVLKKDQMIFKVPEDWVVAVPSSVRRKDTVLFYEIRYQKQDFQDVGNTAANNSSEVQSQGQGTTESDEPPVAYYPTFNLVDDNWLKSFNIEDIITVTDGKIKPPLFTASVAHVTDNANREVVTVGKYDGSAQLSSVEIIITLKELRAMELSIEKGNKFLVLCK